MSTPVAQPLDLPPGYGASTEPLAWEVVSRRLLDAPVYWLASVRPDGRPHVVPRDGFWIDDALFYGGSPETVHHRNVTANPNVTVTIGNGADAVIVEGTAGVETLPDDLRARVAGAHVKYPQYGPPPAPEELDVSSMLILRPRRVLAWTSYPADCTRFTFG